MDQQKLKELLNCVASGDVSPDDAMNSLRTLPFEDLGFAKVDHHRNIRKGYPESIFCEGKTPEQVVEIISRMKAHQSNVLATRCNDEIVKAVMNSQPDAVHHKLARCITLTQIHPVQRDGYVAVVCAGTSDIPVAEEAAVTCESFGNTVKRIYDVGVAGIHRLLKQRTDIEEANAVIVCAGMEGALASVIGGLIDKPIIAVPTSIGYGASFGGIAALLSMLNSCASGVAVVNIDNGFGAGIYAGIINRMVSGKNEL